MADDENGLHNFVSTRRNKTVRKAIKIPKRYSNPNDQSQLTQLLTQPSNITTEIDNPTISINHDSISVDDEDNQITYCDNEEGLYDESKKTMDLMNEFSNYNKFVKKSTLVATFLNYLLSNSNENPKYLYFCLFADEILNSNDEKDIYRWSRELFTVFLYKNSPLNLLVNNQRLLKKFDILDDYILIGNVKKIRELFNDAKSEALITVQKQLVTFRSVSQMGLTGLFALNDEQKFLTETESIFAILKQHVIELYNNIGKFQPFWNEKNQNDGQSSALTSCLASFLKRHGINFTNGKNDLATIPTLLNKKPCEVSIGALQNLYYSTKPLPWTDGDSDFEIEETLPSFVANVEKSKLEKLTANERTMQEGINEIIHTEQKHVRNLKIMKHHFYEQIKKTAYLTSNELELLFPNLDTILGLHSDLNSRLKFLRKNNSIIPIKQFIDIVLLLFDGEKGLKFQKECAEFCRNQSEAMKFLHKRASTKDEFTTFLQQCECHTVCRKLQLTDFLLNEAQRLPKYSLLFELLVKKSENENDKIRLKQCSNASTRISVFVDSSIKECENRKYVAEIQQKLDTTNFDAYCIKSSLLKKYKNLDISNRELKYSGEIEFKTAASNTLLLALLFSDIIVFLEKNPSNDGTNEKRFALKPLIFSLDKKNCTFTPVVPLNFIISMHNIETDKRSFCLVVIIPENSHSQSFKQKSSMTSQMLFMLQAKSGDDKAKWISHLETIIGPGKLEIYRECSTLSEKSASPGTDNDSCVQSNKNRNMIDNNYTSKREENTEKIRGDLSSSLVTKVKNSEGNDMKPYEFKYDDFDWKKSILEELQNKFKANLNFDSDSGETDYV